MTKVLIKKLDSSVELPAYKTSGASGMDLMAIKSIPDAPLVLYAGNSTDESNFFIRTFVINLIDLLFYQLFHQIFQIFFYKKVFLFFVAVVNGHFIEIRTKTNFFIGYIICNDPITIFNT